MVGQSLRSLIVSHPVEHVSLAWDYEVVDPISQFTGKLEKWKMTLGYEFGLGQSYLGLVGAAFRGIYSRFSGMASCARKPTKLRERIL